ncbi:MAG TPA: sodium-dependent transporter [Steroidobacteraceae bacterium]|nr:sodium-dependent transporter [Steroidobacteraceae bacterium]
MRAGIERWSSKLGFYLAAVGAAVGLGSIWRFPYLTGAYGGSAFVFVFILACLAIATPLLTAEFIIGRRSRRNPSEAAGEVAASFGRSRAWNAIGILGTAATFCIMSYYTVIAGWVLAYTWTLISGELTSLPRRAVERHFQEFLSDPLRVGAWHLAFVVLVGGISARGVNRGIELANKIRAPGLLVLLLILDAYALTTGDVRRGIAFAFAPDFGKLSARVVLAAIGQAFFATGVGMAMMLAYGAYVPRGASLVRAALVISGSIVLVSLLATLMIFPLVYRYDLNPAQGTELVFSVLPIAFSEMPGGRAVGALFFLLLVLAALTPSLAGIEPMVAWLAQRRGLSRSKSALIAAAAVWILGIGSVLSFNAWAHWHPLSGIERMRDMTVFDVLDFVSSNVMLPVGALLTCIFIGWRLPRSLADSELPEETPGVRRLVLYLLRYVCPLGIVAVLVAAYS